MCSFSAPHRSDRRASPPLPGRIKVGLSGAVGGANLRPNRGADRTHMELADLSERNGPLFQGLGLPGAVSAEVESAMLRFQTHGKGFRPCHASFLDSERWEAPSPPRVLARARPQPILCTRLTRLNPADFTASSRMPRPGALFHPVTISSAATARKAACTWRDMRTDTHTPPCSVETSCNRHKSPAVSLPPPSHHQSNPQTS